MECADLRQLACSPMSLQQIISSKLNSFYEKVTRVIDEGRAVDVVYMDFSEVFDTIPHGMLKHKLMMHGTHRDLVTSKIIIKKTEKINIKIV